MNGFSVPKQDDIPREGRALPDATIRQNLALTKVEAGTSKKGDPQMIWHWTIDTGADAGEQTKQYHTFKEGSKLAWQKLANVCDAAGFTWEDAPTVEAFAAQFPIDGSFRISVEIEHRYQVAAFVDQRGKHEKYGPLKTAELPYGPFYLDTTKEEVETWEGDTWVDWQIRDGFDFSNIFGPPTTEAELVQYGADTPLGVKEDGTIGPADDLPF